MPYDRYLVRLWSIINMEKALQYYLTHTCTLAEAAKEFEVPPSTLHTRYDFTNKRANTTEFVAQSDRRWVSCN